MLVELNFNFWWIGSHCSVIMVWYDYISISDESMLAYNLVIFFSIYPFSKSISAIITGNFEFSYSNWAF